MNVTRFTFLFSYKARRGIYKLTGMLTCVN